MRQKAPKRCTARWRKNAPDYVADVFDHPAFADRYTIFFAYPYADTAGEVMYLGTSQSGGVSGSGSMKPHEFGRYRMSQSRRRIAWETLPAETRALVQRWHEAS